MMSVRALVGVLASLAVFGCTSVQGKVGDSDAQLRERVEQRWKHLIAGELDEAYTYLSPGSRDRTGLVAYKGRIRSGLWRSAKVAGVRCEDVVCRIEVNVGYAYMRPGAKYESERILEETWVREDGQWWFLLPH